MDQNSITVVRVTPEGPRTKGARQAWSVPVGKIWPEPKLQVILVPEFPQGRIDAVPADSWVDSPHKAHTDALAAALEEADSPHQKHELRRKLAVATFPSHVTSGKLIIPAVIAWVILSDEAGRHVTLIRVGPYMEVWNTRAWWAYMRRTDG